MLHTVATPVGSFLRPTFANSFRPTIDELTVTKFSRLDVAPHGFSGMRCSRNHYFPQAEVWQQSIRTCEESGCDMRGDQGRVSVTDIDSGLVASPESVHSSSWWHATEGNLLFDPNSGPMHVGTYRAALFRAQTMHFVGESIKMWKLQINPGVAIADDVVMDNANIDADNVLAIHVAGTGVVRYINAREDEGSVSLLGHSGNFRVVAEAEIDLPRLVRPARRH